MRGDDDDRGGLQMREAKTLDSRMRGDGDDSGGLQMREAKTQDPRIRGDDYGEATRHAGSRGA